MSTLTCPIVPLNGKVVIKQKPKDTMRGSIIIPDEAGETYNEGEVIVIAEGIESCKLIAGDWVYFNKHAGSILKLNNITYLLMDYDDIICKIQLI